MTKYPDIPHMTVRELCALAEQVRSAPAGSKRAAASPRGSARPPPTSKTLVRFSRCSGGARSIRKPLHVSRRT